MATTQQARAAIAKRFGEKQNRLDAWPAYLGNEDGTVRGSRSGYVYVRYPSLNSAAVEVENGGVPEVANLRVMVGYRSERPNVIMALGVADVRAAISPTPILGQIGAHAPQHAWTGVDPVYLAAHQITNLGVFPSSGFVVTIYQGNIQRGASLIAVAQQTLDLTSSVPTGPDNGRYTLITLDDTGTVATTDGSIIAYYASLTNADIPATPAGHFRLAAVRLYGGQTAIVDRAVNSDILDLRWPQEYQAGDASVVALTTGHIFVGDGSNQAADVALSGDATLATGGALTLASTGVTTGTYGDTEHGVSITLDAKGRATSASNVTLKHYEIVMSPGVTPPDPVRTPDDTDWIYALVA